MSLQKNEIEIIPITIWKDGVTKTLSVLKLDNYFQYDFLMSPGMVHYCICESKTYTLEDGTEATHYVSVIDGNIQMTWEIIEDWGTDDTPIFDYVLNQLNLIRKP